MTWEEMETALRGLYEVQRINSESLGHLIQSVDRFVDTTNASNQAANARMVEAEQSHRRLEESHRRLEESIDRYVGAANARMQQMEANLDALIRIITAEHSNGKGQH